MLFKLLLLPLAINLARTVLFSGFVHSNSMQITQIYQFSILDINDNSTNTISVFAIIAYAETEADAMLCVLNRENIHGIVIDFGLTKNEIIPITAPIPITSISRIFFSLAFGNSHFEFCLNESYAP